VNFGDHLVIFRNTVHAKPISCHARHAGKKAGPAPVPVQLCKLIFLSEVTAILLLADPAGGTEWKDQEGSGLHIDKLSDLQGLATYQVGVWQDHYGFSIRARPIT
jgi:hypothetical protein